MNETVEAVQPIVGKCACHRVSGVIHVRACCEGQCRTCGKWFKVGRKVHETACAGGVLPGLPDTESGAHFMGGP
jgi:hypothetical protein